MDSLQMVKEAISGSKDAFVTLIRDNEGLMYGVARGLVNTDNDAADAIQEAILNAYRNLYQLRDPAYFRTWLIRILINECRKIAKQNSQFVAIGHLLESTAATSSSNVEDRLELNELLDGLELDHREVIALYYIEDIPVKEIAQILDLSEGTVKSRLYRARSKLAAMMNHSSTKEALQ